MISVTILYVFNSGISSWIKGQAFYETQKVTSQALNKIIEGERSLISIYPILKTLK